MNYRQLGNSGVRVSVIGLGANRFGSENVPQTEVSRIIAAALELGINFIDTSNNYTQAIQKRPSAMRSRDLPGDKVVLATKFSFPKKDGPNTWGRRVTVMQAVEGGCAACKRITSTSIMPIVGMTPRR